MRGQNNYTQPMWSHDGQRLASNPPTRTATRSAMMDGGFSPEQSGMMEPDRSLSHSGRGMTQLRSEMQDLRSEMDNLSSAGGHRAPPSLRQGPTIQGIRASIQRAGTIPREVHEALQEAHDREHGRGFFASEPPQPGALAQFAAHIGVPVTREMRDDYAAGRFRERGVPGHGSARSREEMAAMRAELRADRQQLRAEQDRELERQDALVAERRREERARDELRRDDEAREERRREDRLREDRMREDRLRDERRWDARMAPRGGSMRMGYGPPMSEEDEFSALIYRPVPCRNCGGFHHGQW